MSKKNIYFLIAIMIFITSCRKDSTPQASPEYGDPFARIDNAQNEADHQIYLYYKESVFPVLYSDTLRKTPLALLNLGYFVSSIDSLVRVKYLTKPSDIISGLGFVKDQLIPYLGGSVKPYSILLTDTTFTLTPDNNGKNVIRTPIPVYIGLNTVAISYVGSINTMNQDVLKRYRAGIFKAILTAKLVAPSSLQDQFYAVSNAYYNKTATGSNFTNYTIPYARKEVYGLLSNGTEGATSYYTGSQTPDMSSYLDLVLSTPATDILSAYQGYPLVLQKYNLLLQILKNLGFTIPA